MAGESSFFSNITMGDVGLGLQGIGTIASAWGTYENMKARNKLIQDQINYQKAKDALVQKKLDDREKTIAEAFGSYQSEASV